MSEKKVHRLLIDKEFRNLIRPLQRAEYLQLEANILTDGCRDPITIWKGYIIDGHNRYEICTRHSIPFTIVQMEFECREEVIAWICTNQLGRRNITAETTKYLIGMQYEAEKNINKVKNAQGVNQYSSGYMDKKAKAEKQKSIHRTAQRIASENHVSQATVQKYAEYTRALDEVGRKVPEVVPKILSGQYKISHKNLVELSKLSADNIRKMVLRIELVQQPFVHYSQTRREIQANPDTSDGKKQPVASVKDMPAFDPDAEITGLTLTIPSWTNSLKRIQTKTNLSNVSARAKEQLRFALLELDVSIDDLFKAIKEG